MGVRDEYLSCGDRVLVNFNNSKSTLCRGIIRYMPQATGDSWIIEADNGEVHFISEGCTITKTYERQDITNIKLTKDEINILFKATVLALSETKDLSLIDERNFRKVQDKLRKLRQEG